MVLQNYIPLQYATTLHTEPSAPVEIKMDFASLMGSAMGKQSIAPKSGNFVRRADVEAEREEAYRIEQSAIAAAKAEKAINKRKLEEIEAEKKAVREEKRQRLAEESKIRREKEERIEENAKRKRLGLPPLAEVKAVEETSMLKDDIEDDDLRCLLRDLEQPIALFAETHTARLQRYRALISKPVLSNGPIPTTLKLVPEAEMEIKVTKPPSASKELNHLYCQLASYFTMILEEWTKALDRRDPEVKASREGQAAYAAMEQSKINLEPLFRKFEKGDLAKSILEPIVEIVAFAQKRRYVDANDTYLQLSIGKAYVMVMPKPHYIC